MQIQNPMMFTRSIKGAPSSVLWALLLTRQPLTVRQLCAYTDYKPDTVREAMAVLVSYELAVEAKKAHGESAYILGEGYQFLLSGIDPKTLGRVVDMALPESEKIGLWELDALPQDSEKQRQNPKKSDSGIETLPQDSEKQRQNPKKSDSGEKKQGSSINQNQSINQLIDDDDELIKFQQESSSSSIMNPNLNFFETDEKTTEHILESTITAVFPKSEFPRLEKILAGMDILFGDHLEPSLFAPDLSPQLALAWICKGYLDAQRNPNFKNPVGMIRRRLEKKVPRSLSHLQEMPAEFLEFIGLFEGVCQFCQASFRTRRELNEHIRTEHTEPADTEPADVETDVLDLDLDDENTDPVAQEIWEATKTLLQADMPRAPFESWVRDSRGVAVAEKTLLVVARNQFAADWLRERISDDCLVIFGRMGMGIESVSFAAGGNGAAMSVSGRERHNPESSPEPETPLHRH